MKELGAASRRHHVAVGRQAARLLPALLVTVGAEAAAVGQGATAAGLDAAAHVHVDDATAAGEAVLAHAAPGDAVLFKASRAARLEQAVAHVRTTLDEDSHPSSTHRRVA